MNHSPATPPDVAAAVLDAILARPDTFNMATWIDADGPLAPDDEPDCGTTLCVAAWAAHLTGWTVHNDTATRNGEARRIEDVGREALGLTHEDANALFLAGPFTATTTLKFLAKRSSYAPPTAPRTRRRRTPEFAPHFHGLAPTPPHPRPADTDHPTEAPA
ncbi:hypothetical protein OG393_30930 [Streptomyces sp. NBC_01216]|uniref:hypothetical protein n=1 Tax=Streptomyces sp. NBC_01216 TaxID=2903778 RepID=UPI002E11A355|nr:hypothetical protein OG393_30930 [Streptomyces sp. NBC_01216]